MVKIFFSQEDSTIARLENVGKDSVLPDPRVIWQRLEQQGALPVIGATMEIVGNLGRSRILCILSISFGTDAEIM